MTNLTVIQSEVQNSIRDFALIKAKIDELAQQCSGLLITDEPSLALGKDLAIKAKKITTIIEDRRVEATKPFFDAKKDIDNFAKDLTNNLNNSTQKLRDQILYFEKEKERKRLEELRKVEEERRRKEEEFRKLQEEEMQRAQALQNKDNADVPTPSMNGDLQVDIIIDKRNELESVAAQQAELQQQKSSNIRKFWTYELIDLKSVPFEYLILDERKVKESIAQGTREIPGLRIFQEEKLFLR